MEPYRRHAVKVQHLPNSFSRLRWLTALFIFLLAILSIAQESSNRRPELALQTGHTGAIGAVAFSPDGRWLASGSEDYTVKLWDVATGLEVRTLTGQWGVNAVAFSPDGRWLASGSNDNTVKVWDVTTGREVRTLIGPRKTGLEAVNALSFSPDGRWLAAGNADSTVNLWDVATGQEGRTLAGHEQSISAVAFSPDGRWLASGSRDATAKLWEVATGRVVRTLIGHRKRLDLDAVLAVAFSPDGRWIACGAEQGLFSKISVLRLWDVATGREVRTLTPDASVAVNAVAFSPDGRWLASGSDDNTVKLWDVTTSQEVRTLTGHTSVKAVAFYPDGRWLASAEGYGVTIWDVTTGREARTLAPHVDFVNALAFSPDGRWLASGGGTVKVWEQDGRDVRTLTANPSEYAFAIAFSSDGRLLASANHDFKTKLLNLRLSDVATGKSRAVTVKAKTVSVAFAFSPDGSLLASAEERQTVKLWETTTGRELRTLSAANVWIDAAPNAVAFSPDGHWLASANLDGTVKVWDVITGTEECALTVSQWSIHSVAFSPDGRWLASGNGDVKLWDVPTWREVRTLAGGDQASSGVEALAFSRDGRWLASGKVDGSVKLWDVETGRELRTLTGHSNKVRTVAFSPDGHWVISGSWDGGVRIWNTSTGEDLALLSAMRESNDWVVATPDGLFDGSEEGTQRLVAWRIGNNVYPPDRFFNDYYTPGLLAQIFAGENPKPKIDLATLRLPPEVHVSAPLAGAKLQQQRVAATVEAEDLGGGVAEVRLYQNGKLVGTRPGVSGAKTQYTFEVELIPGENNLEASGLSRERVESNKYPVRVIYEVPAPSKPVLHLLVVGINEYEDPKYDLDFAQPDAQAIARFFDQHGGLFRSIDAVKLFDKQATKTNIQVALEQLVQRAVGEDVVLIYMAGHGVALGEQFYFLSQGMRTEEDEDAAVRKYGVTAKALSDALLQIKALKQILILDTCQSGTALPILAKATMFRLRLGPVEEKAVKMLARSNGFYLIAAATAEQYAHEVPELGHGVLTYALLSGLGEKGEPLAPTGAEGIVTMYSLLQYVNQQVPELTEKYHQGNKQYPVSSNTGMDFPLRVR